MLAGALAFGPEWSSKTVARKLATGVARYAWLQPRLLYSDEFFTLYAIERVEDNPRDISWSRGIDEHFWVVGDSNYDSGSMLHSRPMPEDLAQVAAMDIPGRWVSVQVKKNSGMVRLGTDRLGIAWLYIAKGRNGYVFSSDFSSVVAHSNCQLTVDYDTALIELSAGYSPDDRTVFEQISIVPPGSVVELRANEIARVLERSVEYGDKYANATERAKFELLDAIFERIAREQVKDSRSSLALSLSAGYDSRYALAFLKKYGAQLELFTFGHPQSEEVRKAESICNRISADTQVFSIPESTWEQWRRCIQQMGNAGMVQWSGWAESWLSLLSSHGKNVVIGYLGDALTGKHLRPMVDDSVDWLRYWTNWSTNDVWSSSSLLRASAKGRLQGCFLDRLRGVGERASYAFPHQQVFHFDLYGRQRRWVASQPNLISRFLTPNLFFYDNALIDFWSNVALPDLQGQRLYLRYAQSRFPQLFPRDEGRKKGLLRRVLAKSMNIAKRAVGEHERSRSYPVIDRDKFIIPNRDRILQLTRKVAPIVDPIIDIASFQESVAGYPDTGDLSSAELIRAVNLFFLLEVCVDGTDAEVCGLE